MKSLILEKNEFIYINKEKYKIYQFKKKIDRLNMIKKQ